MRTRLSDHTYQTLLSRARPQEGRVAPRRLERIMSHMIHRRGVRRALRLFSALFTTTHATPQSIHWTWGPYLIDLFFNKESLEVRVRESSS